VGAVVSFRGITRRFGSLLANDAISFDVERGSVHVLLGENGAGKTTLLSILAGFLRADAGEILIDGQPLEQGSPRVSLRRGIGLCAQHFLLAGALTGAENILLGSPECVGLRTLPRARLDRLLGIARANGLDAPLDLPVEELSVAEQERIEILKLLERDCSILVLDEPTSVLAPSEVRPLFATLRALAAQGKTILLVTHRLAEVTEIADRVTVLRGGRVAGEAAAGEIDRDLLVRWIVGEEIQPPLARREARPGETVLALRSLRCGTGACAPQDVSLMVRAGEVVGIGGVLGNGQTEIVRAITGQIPIQSGEIEILGRRWGAPQRTRLADEIAWIPEDRRAEGLALEMSCGENLRVGLPWRLFPGRRAAVDLLRGFDVRPLDPELPAASLSGGNQQRLLLAREMSRRARLLLAVHPTRGLDPGATAFVHERLLAARAAGTGILLVTGDLAELLALSDRIAILFRGRVGYAAEASGVDGQAMNRALVGLSP